MGLHHRPFEVERQPKPPFCRHVLPISLSEVVGRIPPAWLRQLVKRDLLRPKMLRVMQSRFADCADDPAGFIIHAQLGQLRIVFVIILVLPILRIIQTCKIARIISDGVQHLLKCCFGLWDCQSRLFSISHIFLLMLDCIRCVFNSFPCQSGLSIHKILDPFLLLFLASKVHFWSLLCRQLLFKSQGAHCPQGSDPFCIQAALAFIPLMMSSCGTLCGFAAFASPQWQNVLSRHIDNWIFCWHCWWARCWMLHNMDAMEASCVFYIDVGTLNRPEQCNLGMMTVTTLGMAMLTVHHYMIFGVCPT